MMSHRAECGHENVNVLRAPARLGESKHWHQQERRRDVQDQVARTVQNPEGGFRHSRLNCRYGLRTRKRGDVLHLFERTESLNPRQKSMLLLLGPGLRILVKADSRCAKSVFVASLQLIGALHWNLAF